MPKKVYPQTSQQSAAIREYFRINLQTLNHLAIERQAAVYPGLIQKLLNKEVKHLSPENIEKLLPVLRKLGFEMLSISADTKNITYAVCKLSGVSLEQMRAPTQKRHIIEEKQILIYLLQKHTKDKQADIAKLLEREDSNISLALKRITGLLEVEPRIKAKVKKYEQEIFKNL